MKDVLKLHQQIVDHHKLKTQLQTALTKPVSFSALVEVMKAFGRYWIGIVEIPSLEADGAGAN